MQHPICKSGFIGRISEKQKISDMVAEPAERIRIGGAVEDEPVKRIPRVDLSIAAVIQLQIQFVPEFLKVLADIDGVFAVPQIFCAVKICIKVVE